jgi:ketosteroid isomerase-like protein/predicted SnoaL-like aldol condensation-catalyzing enzyme
VDGVGARISGTAGRLASTGLVLGLVAGCASTPKPAPSPEAVRSEARNEVLEAEQRWWHAVSSGDVDHALRRFSDDTVFETPDGSQVHGRVALSTRLRRDQHDRLEVNGVPEHVHVDSPDLVVVTGTGRWTQGTAEPDQSTTVRYIDTWKWTGSSWRLVSAAASPTTENPASTKLVQQVLAAWSKGDWAGLQPLLAPGYRARSESRTEGGELRRRFETFHRNWTAARFDIEEQFAVGERIVTRIRATLTEAGTGRTVRYSGLDVSRVVDGQLADHWDSWEEVGPSGAAPQPATPPPPVETGSTTAPETPSASGSGSGVARE